MKTFIVTKEQVQHHWYFVDANAKVLGRFSSQIVHYLRGKHKAEYTPHVDTGDYIIVLNANKIIVTGNKKYNKIYYRYTGYIGGIKKETFIEIMSRHPERAISIAVKGMLPKGPLGRAIYKKLKIYSGNQHNHAAQHPKFLNI